MLAITLVRLLVVAAVYLQAGVVSGRELPGRGLLGCGTYSFGQCGGVSSGKRADRAWGCCPARHYCKRQDKWWWSCQPGSAPKPQPAKKATPPKKPTPPKKTPPKKTPPKKTPPKKTPSNRRERTHTDYSNPTTPAGKYPQCVNVEYTPTRYSHWCTLPPVAGQCLPDVQDGRFGRMTVYNGPVINHKGYCNWNLEGSATYASVAISSKYLKTFGGAPCGRCMCVQIMGVDEHSMYGQDPSALVRRHKYKVFLARVSDQCAECEDEHIDILLDKPFTEALVDPSNPMGAEARRRRASVPAVMPLADAVKIGVWKSCWMWAPHGCNTDCSQYMG